jgi:hypothetical protein
LLASGIIPAPNFLTVDVEGYEKFVFLAVIEFETSFTSVRSIGTVTQGLLQEILISRALLLFDLNFDRCRGLKTGNTVGASNAVRRSSSLFILRWVRLKCEGGGNKELCRQVARENSSVGLLSALGPHLLETL